MRLLQIFIWINVDFHFIPHAVQPVGEPMCFIAWTWMNWQSFALSAYMYVLVYLWMNANNLLRNKRYLIAIEV